ncbi:hypothetical protein C467_00766 [Halorubrum hochstenium ATCC 700873]|uniref:VanZ family protein n=1 Tax=Halorubrum hochstenium ATCC 700873 TaxID=1227481 RepID=M0FNK8_9EURY|nr:hypothetical protein [Halorubrum hochstenium]ELZ61520.1 hypothetical protein C467_00766 [Halorubrum hochstenium ATCC 700873]
MSGVDADRSAGERGGAWRPFLAGAAVVLVASLLPVPGALAGPGGGPAVGAPVGPAGGAPVGPLAALGPTAAFHLIGYAGLAALATRATDRAVVAAVASTAVGFCVELAQLTVAWRSFAWVDAGVNAVGAAVGVAAVAAVAALRRSAG